MQEKEVSLSSTTGREAKGRKGKKDELVRSTVTLSKQRTQLRIHRIPRPEDMPHRLGVLSVVNRDDRSVEEVIRRILLHDRDVVLHQIPLLQRPSSSSRKRSHLPMICHAHTPPLALDEIRELIPLSESVQAAHLSEDDLAVLLSLGGFPIEGGVGFLPAVELEVPAFVVELLVVLSSEGVVLVSSIGEDSPGGVLLLKLRVDVDEGFDDVSGGIGEPFELLVVESFGVGSMLEGLKKKEKERGSQRGLKVGSVRSSVGSRLTYRPSILGSMGRTLSSCSANSQRLRRRLMTSAGLLGDEMAVEIELTRSSCEREPKSRQF